MSLLHSIGMLCGAALLSAGPGTEPVYAVDLEPDVVYSTAEGYWSEAPDDFWGRLGLLFHRSDKRRPLDLKMDIYRPADDPSDKARPLLVMLHGGAYFIGHKTEPGQVEWCRYFASLGYVAVSVDYRMGYRMDKAHITRAEQEAVEDTEHALKYLQDRDDLRIDWQQVYLAGTSAGATTALSLAYGKPAAFGQIRAVANLWGYVHDLDLLQNARIPILSYQSEKDPVVPYREGYPLNMRLLTEKAYGTRCVHEKALELGIPAEHHSTTEKRHKLHLDSHGALTPLFYEIRDRMAAFFAAAGN